MTAVQYVRPLGLLFASLFVALAAPGCTDATPSMSGGTDVGPDAGADAETTEGTPDGSVDTLPRVSMAEVVVQSQVEPFRGDQSGLPGKASVERVQQALADEGFDVTVDGWFGSGTAARYADWQEKLGYSGLDANGIPGPTSLATLGKNRFVIEHVINVGARTTYSGQTVNQRTRDMLVKADSLIAHSITVTQGSYNAGGVAASAGTHDGGGAVDISAASLTTTQRWQTVQALRKVGFAAWLRNPNQGPWPYHIHAIAIGDTDLAAGARDQVADYYVGKNGLASHAADDTPAAYRVPFTWWENQ